MTSPVTSSELERIFACGRSVCTMTRGARGSVTSTPVKFFGAAWCASHRMRRPPRHCCSAIPSPMPPKPCSSWWARRRILKVRALAIALGYCSGKNSCKHLRGGPVTRILLFCLALICSNAFSQTYPSKPVRLIVTYPPGGSSDLMARVFGQKLSEVWGQQVIVESKPGAAGSIGMEYSARQPADGYTFVVGNIGPAAVNPLLSKVPYSMEKDFVPVSLISTGPNVLVVNTAWQVNSLGEILAYARANPGKLSYGTNGPGSVSHLSSEMLKNLTKANMVEIPYKGGVLGVQDLLGQQIQFIFSDALPAMAHIRAGKLRALCTTGAQKFALLPDLPTCDATVHGLVAVNWWGVLLPAGTPRAIVGTVPADLGKVKPDPGVKPQIADLGVEAISSTPAQFNSFIHAEMDKYARLIKEANIKVNP